MKTPYMQMYDDILFVLCSITSSGCFISILPILYTCFTSKQNWLLSMLCKISVSLTLLYKSI